MVGMRLVSVFAMVQAPPRKMLDNQIAVDSISNTVGVAWPPDRTCAHRLARHTVTHHRGGTPRHRQSVRHSRSVVYSVNTPCSFENFIFASAPKRSKSARFMVFCPTFGVLPLFCAPPPAEPLTR